ncbi:MAG: hypothetical protein SGARI_000936 [Bacillariaceae sp.]
MPVYLCQPGLTAEEPWRHGIQVYAAPFDLVDIQSSKENNNDNHDTREGVARPAGEQSQQQQQQPAATTTANANNSVASSTQIIDSAAIGAASVNYPRAAQSGVEIRRIRHAEVVLVDDVCVAFERHWLRLRWPGHKGGFAGYIALGKVNDKVNLPKQISDALQDAQINQITETNTASSGGDVLYGEEDLRDGHEDDPDQEPQDNASTLSAEPFESNSKLTCLRTGLVFPSTVAMKLLAMYDDGLAPPVGRAPLPSEPVFCRICREGLHDDADDEQPSPAVENDADDGGQSSRGASRSPSGSFGDAGDEFNAEEAADDGAEGREPMESEPSATLLFQGPVQPNPTYHPNTHASENPMLSPCECSGSMAFVHYMCVEQWRCRSRHPAARQGLNCETCGKPYALPPPSARPQQSMLVDNDEWLEAMPPHVMAALRQPHIWWQLGAAIVRRRYLRPLAPVIMSPIVALYCRARRLLKKKGVARRRWACSLCRRRARWKCVRCLRSYYCSRQCQNVSWHIVHKHVCYKPSRWFQSVAVYGIATAFLIPGVLRDPLVYDAGLGFIPIAFYVMAILGGGIASVFKKSVGVDLRGRSFEIAVVLGTVGLVRMLWGLLGAFLGNQDSCVGLFGTLDMEHLGRSSMVLNGLQKAILVPAERWFLMWDSIAANSGPMLCRLWCMPDQEEGCFEYSHKANADFLFDAQNEGRCSSDMMALFYLLLSTLSVALFNNIWKRRERQRRAAARRPRVHQD